MTRSAKLRYPRACKTPGFDYLLGTMKKRPGDVRSAPGLGQEEPSPLDSA